MKVCKFASVPAPAYPSHRQFAECKLLLGAAVIGLGSAVQAADRSVAVDGLMKEARQEAPAKPTPAPAPADQPKPSTDKPVPPTPPRPAGMPPMVPQPVSPPAK